MEVCRASGVSFCNPARASSYTAAATPRKLLGMSVLDLAERIPMQLGTLDGRPVVWLEGPEKHVQEIVGESHYQQQLQAATSNKPCPNHWPMVTHAWLVPELDNTHDPTAVAIWIGGGKVGHLPRVVARCWWHILRTLNILHDASCACPAKIVGGDVVRGERRLYGVWLAFPVDTPSMLSL
jgi:hypothetical protein